MNCSFSKDFLSNSRTSVENAFIKDYLPLISGDAVKVYLYGLYLCNNPSLSVDIKEAGEKLNLSQNEIADCYALLEEFGLVNIIDRENLSVTYLPINQTGYTKPRKFKADKYTEFSKALQGLINSRMISTTEFTEYFNILETYSIKPEAMLLIVKYCIDRKGDNIGYHYISKVAKDFGARGLNTIEKVENELSSYVAKTAEISGIFKALSIRRLPDIEDLNYYKKWTNELKFEYPNILHAAKALKKGNMNKLDEFMLELYSMKSFSKEEIETYVKNKQNLYELAIKINKALAIYVEVVDTEVETFIKKWTAYGFSENSLILIANNLFKKGNNSLQKMDELIEGLRLKGFIDYPAICDFFETDKKSDEFISKMLSTCGLNRRPTPWDRDNLAIWKTWNFADEMILEAAKLASGKASPIAYINAILSSWKNKGIYSVSGAIKTGEKSAQEAYNEEYSRRRTLANFRAQKNTTSAMEIDGFSKVYERLFSIEKDLAFAELSGNIDTLNAFEKEKIECNKKANAMLKTIGLSLEDLSPKYACEKCKDTGYIGTKKCDCFDLEVK